MRLGWLAVGVALLGAAGCEREKRAEPARATAAATPPLAFEQNTGGVELSLTLPEALRAHPALHKRLYDEDTAALASFAEGAREERAGMGADMPPYSLTVAWRVAAETERLLSLVREEESYAGGAHPNSDVRALLWDKQAGREAPVTALLAGEARYPEVEAKLCAALAKQKAERGGAPIGGGDYPCPKVDDSQAALAPGGRGKAGGLTFLFPPYAVGAYAEGAYEVTLPTSSLKPALAPAYRSEFAG